MDSQVTAFRKVQLTDRSWYMYKPKSIFLKAHVFDELWGLRDMFATQTCSILGKRTRIPRRQGLFSDEVKAHNYGGVQVMSEPLCAHEFLGELLKKTNAVYNTLFVSWYSNGKDYFVEHSDDDLENVAETPIVCLTFGASRTFRIRKKACRSIVMDIPLSDGDVFLMGGHFQSDFFHEITKKATSVGNDCRNLSITMRAIKINTEDDVEDTDWERFFDFDAFSKRAIDEPALSSPV
eukprot:gene252-448_t